MRGEVGKGGYQLELRILNKRVKHAGRRVLYLKYD